MSNIYYRHSINGGPGIFARGPCSEAGRCLLQWNSSQYAGQQFPTTAQDQTDGSAVLRVLRRNSTRMVCRFSISSTGDLTCIEQAVQAGTAKLLLISTLDTLAPESLISSHQSRITSQAQPLLLRALQLNNAFSVA
jgi:hypothetical protein